MNKEYNESTIKTLGSLEHIRLRSGMYIGRLGNGSQAHDGIYIMLKEVIDNGIDEYIMGYGSVIEISIADESLVRVRDYGRGIPFGKLVDCASVINTGAKYNTDVFQFSVGLNGVGIKAVNALSSQFSIRSIRGKKFAEAQFKQGKLTRQRKGSTTEKDGTLLCFLPDSSIFPTFAFSDSIVQERLSHYAFLNPGMVLRYKGEEFHSKRGLLDFLEHKLGGNERYTICHARGKQIEFAFTHAEQYGESMFSFVNGQYTSDGGTHQNAFREGLLRGINDYLQKNYVSSDLKDGLLAAISVRLQDPIFESQTKNKLGNTDIRPWILQETRVGVHQFLLKHPDVCKSLQETLQRNEELRKELAQVRKKAREAARKTAITISNLRDCKYHRGHKKYGENTLLFITEGQSAAGSMMSARDVYTQAVFALRGKPKNMIDKKRADIYHVEELYNLMVALGIEQDTESLRYEHIVIATDADHDGYHIRNLLLTFFFRYYEGLVAAGHVYILETPIFRVRNKQTQRYCYSEQEKNDALQTIKNAELTRFKGLGEISPHEFRAFIGPDMRLLPVELVQFKALQETLTFFMGSNTPERKSYIMEHLIDAAV